MRLLIDMQGAQTASRLRGIGRYTRSLVQEMAQQRGEHEILLALSAVYADTIELIRAAFVDLLPADAIHVFEVPRPVGGFDATNDSRRKAAECMQEAFFISLQPDVILISSLIEDFGGEAVTSIHQFSNVIPTAVIFYDLIPLVYESNYLRDSDIKRWYFGKIDHLKRADLLLSISESSGREAKYHLNFPAQSIVNISAACDGQFYPIDLSDAQRTHLAVTYGIDRPFIMYTGDTDFRKNLGGLLRAYAILPVEMRSAYPLVLVGLSLLKEKNHFLDVAEQAGLQENDLFFTGFVSDLDLNLIYNACSLFVFPSWHEGFGLPVLEAMACGKAVIAANSSSLPEVVGRQDALFSPRDDADMAAKMAEVLSNVEFRQQLERHGLVQAQKFTWKISASRAWDALEILHAKKSNYQPEVRNYLARRPILAVVSPLPPVNTGLTDDVAVLLSELTRYYDITVICQQEAVCEAWVQANLSIRDAAWLRQNAYLFDRVLYHMGNSDQYAYILSLMEDIPGMLVMNDFFLPDPLTLCMDVQPEHFRALTKALYHSHGWKALADYILPDHLAEAVMAWPCNLPMLQQALGVIVHSDFSRKLACRFYGDKAANDFVIIPESRQPAPQKCKATIRQNLGLTPQDFVICSFDVSRDTMLNQRLLDAWLATPLAGQSDCYLVFVSKSQDGVFGKALVQSINECLAKDRIWITDWTSAERYHDWLATSDMVVNLCTLSRGENVGTVLDCMNYGLPVIANTYDSMTELPGDTVWLLPVAFSDAQLTEAITTLYGEETNREQLGTKAMAHIRTQHNPRFIADQYATAIEATYNQAEQTLYGLNQVLPQLLPSLPLSEYPQLANVFADNFPPQPRRRQLLLDLSELVQRDAKTGIQRVVRAILKQFIMNPPEGCTVEPVYATSGLSGYRYARKFMCRFLGIPADWAEDTHVQVWQDDVFLGLDFQPQIVPEQQIIFNKWRNRGVRLFFVVYDLLPVLMPEVFPEGAKEIHQRWLQTITSMDGALCISRAVADELHDWLQTFGVQRERPFAVDWFHLGADVNLTSPTRGMPSDAPQILRSLRSRPSFLMVGTIEPRKGILQTLKAFDQLWAQGADINLVIVGKEGWKPLPDIQRGDIPQTVEALRTHPELGHQLFWLEAISDEYLEQVYSASTCLIAASYGEGFGLPLIEAARHGIPLLVRDIPVFREVVAAHATFFSDTCKPEAIVEGVSNWLALYAKDRYPRSDTLLYLTWAASASKALEIVLGNHLHYFTWLPDGIRRFWSADSRMYSQVGLIQGRSIKTGEKPGLLIYGPSQNFDSGEYRLILQGSAEHWVGSEILDIVCGQGNNTIFRCNLSQCELGHWQKEYKFILKKACPDLDIRIRVFEETMLFIERISIKEFL